MITVPSQEIAAFLGNHLDHVLHRTGTNFLSSVAADREFRAGCAIMDLLNAVESAQESLRQLLVSKNGSKPSEFQTMEVRVMSLYLLHYLYSYLPIHQNPFLCLFVDIYNLAMQDENLRPERFVTSVILNGKGEELATKTPSELIELAQKVESRPVNIRMLEDFLPDVPIEDQVQVGLGWESQQGKELEDENSRIIAETIGSRHGDDEGSSAVVLPSSPQTNGSKEVSGTEMLAPVNGAAAEETEEEELEEWEIEAERRFQDSDVDEAPMPAPVATPAKKSTPTTPTSNGKGAVSSKKSSPLLEVATTATPPPEQEGRRRRKLWARK
ncbi:hypothetical protein EMPS_07708 [Entomortierella parvispora]|uniref:Uncharacterized protein n=1 Tax=Entomortierella parvispora TaxID=205924 RepID=A0A9P3HF09_9FUNG|nr:hypothetical protein EMPS_07708 [Entomortierella parvispora]